MEAGEEFSVRVNLFDTRAETVGMVEAAMARMGEAGMGPGRGRAAMEEMKTEAVALGFEPEAGGWRRVIVQFLTPVELKGSEDGRPEFGVLAARLRDRTSALARFYGDGAWEADFRGFGERARGVRTVRSELMRTEAARRSSRTGQVHGIGGWVGEVEYEGEMGEFLPFLRAGRWTGVGRQTSWGKGELGVSVPVLEGGPEAG